MWNQKTRDYAVVTVSVSFQLCGQLYSHDMNQPWVTMFCVASAPLSGSSAHSCDHRVSSRNVVSLQSTSRRRYFRGSSLSFRRSFFCAAVAVASYSRQAHSRTASSRLITFFDIVWSPQLTARLFLCRLVYTVEQHTGHSRLDASTLYVILYTVIVDIVVIYRYQIKVYLTLLQLTCWDKRIYYTGQWSREHIMPLYKYQAYLM